VDFSYIQFGDSFMPPGRALRSSRWKYAVTASARHKGKPTAPTYRETHLYDLRADPYELDNLIHSHSHGSVCRELRETLRRRIRETGEPATTIQTARRPRTRTQRTVQYPNEG
jgi:arylsulfatase A-like enzyme